MDIDEDEDGGRTRDLCMRVLYNIWRISFVFFPITNFFSRKFDRPAIANICPSPQRIQ